MNAPIDHTRLHRTAKYFMDSGRAATHAEAMDLLRGFRLLVRTGPEVSTSAPHQVALLTLVNLARRTFLGGVEVIGLSNAPLLVPLAVAETIVAAVEQLGGACVEDADMATPAALIGTCNPVHTTAPSWRVTWEGWRGGVTPARDSRRLLENNRNPLAAALAAAICAAELFAWCAGDHAMAGRRATGLSLWRPGHDWTVDDRLEPTLSYLPSRLWLIGLGNLGQAFAWLLVCLPYRDRAAVELVLQDFDRLAESNDSTSVLSSMNLVGRKKTRAIGMWLEGVGFSTIFEERRFGDWTKRAAHEPGVALCGVDNALARAALGKAGFDLVVEAGLGSGPSGFRNFSTHSFPSPRTPDQIWSQQPQRKPADVSSLPAYVALRKSGIDDCGLAQLASRTVGVPFVGLIAGAIAVSELLRRLHGAEGFEFVSGSATSLEDVESAPIAFVPYAGGHLPVAEPSRSGLPMHERRA